MTGSDSSGKTTYREAQMERMEQKRKERNAEVRDRDECLQCDGDVPNQDFETKFAAAGGVLAGPFCSSECYWEWLA